MLDFDLQIKHLHSERANSPLVIELPEQGVWCLIDHWPEAEGQDPLEGLLSEVIGPGVSLVAVMEALLDGYPALTSCNIMLCHFESFHYELAWCGSVFAYLHNPGLHKLSVLASDDKSSASVGHVMSLLGDLHEGETLIISGVDVRKGVDISDLDSLLSSSLKANALTSSILDSCSSTFKSENLSLAVFRYQEEDTSYSKNDFHHRSPLDRSRYTDNMNGRPLFLFLVLLSIVAILLVI